MGQSGRRLRRGGKEQIIKKLHQPATSQLQVQGTRETITVIRGNSLNLKRPAPGQGRDVFIVLSPSGDLFPQTRYERGDGHGLQRLDPADADSQFLQRLLLVAHHQHVRHLHALGGADLVADGVALEVGYRPDPFLPKHLLESGSRLPVIFAHRNDRGLHRREPNRESPGVMFDKKGKESLDGSQRRAVDDYRPVFGAVITGVFQIEFFRKRKVELNGGNGKLAAQRVLSLEIYFWSVEGGFAYGGDILRFLRIQRLAESALGPLPHLV